MAVEPIVRITRPNVLKVLEQVKTVVHTVVPEKYRYWKTNLAGGCPRPIAVCPGPQRSFLIIDYDFKYCTAKLLTARLHQPVDVSVKKENLKDARDLCYIKGIVFIAERGASAISFVDLSGCVEIKPNLLKRRVDLVSHLERFNLDTNGTIPVLRKRLQDYIDGISKDTDYLDHVQGCEVLSKPSAICAVSEVFLLCGDDSKRVIFQITLEFDGVTIRGNPVKLVSYRNGVNNTQSVLSLANCAYFSAASCDGGLYRCKFSTQVVEKVFDNSSDVNFPTEVNRICAFNGKTGKDF